MNTSNTWWWQQSINEVNIGTRQLNGLSRSRRIKKCDKIRINKTIVGGIGLYGTELWELCKRNKSRIWAMEMDYWRQCYMRTRLDTVKSIDIKEEMEIGVDKIKMIEKKMIIWFARLKLVSAKMWLKELWEWTLSARKKIGRILEESCGRSQDYNRIVRCKLRGGDSCTQMAEKMSLLYTGKHWNRTRPHTLVHNRHRSRREK